MCPLHQILGCRGLMRFSVFFCCFLFQVLKVFPKAVLVYFFTSCMCDRNKLFAGCYGKIRYYFIPVMSICNMPACVKHREQKLFLFSMFYLICCNFIHIGMVLYTSGITLFSAMKSSGLILSNIPKCMGTAKYAPQSLANLAASAIFILFPTPFIGKNTA